MQEVAEKVRQSQVPGEEPITGDEAAVIAAGSPHEVLEHLVGEVRKQVRKSFIDATESEFREFIGVNRYERSGERNDQRNGYRERDMVTEIGMLEDLPIPRARKGNFVPSF